jgi:Outer membrane cytochrome MtrC/MtrF-like, domains II/IV/Class III cytochrome C family
MFKHELAVGPVTKRAVLFAAGVFIAIHLFGSVMDSGTTLSQKRNQSRTSQKRRLDNSHFSHQTHFIEQKLACDSCHKFPTKNWKDVRKGEEAFPDVTEYPEHQSCLACHRREFFARERPAPRICSHCHVKATPRDTSRYPFPSLGDKFLSSGKAENFTSDFRVYFPHDKHLDAISQTKSPREQWRFVRASFQPLTDDSDPKSCSTCHVTQQAQGTSDEEFVTKPPKDLGESFWLKKGTFKTRPVTHAACFTCHNQESELAPLPQDCNACHKLSSTIETTDFDAQLTRKIGIADWYTLTAWRARDSAGAFRHEAHDMSCTKCHNPAAMNTVDVRSLKVPIKSCGGEGCHVTATADEGGILNYEMDQRKADAKFVCVKCHLVFGTKPVPASHSEAIVKSRSDQ